jgi:hypothetical protein
MMWNFSNSASYRLAKRVFLSGLVRGGIIGGSVGFGIAYLIWGR